MSTELQTKLSGKNSLSSNLFLTNEKSYFKKLCNKISNFLLDVRSLQKDMLFLPTLKSIPTSASLRRRVKEVNRLKKRLVERNEEIKINVEKSCQQHNVMVMMDQIIQDLTSENEQLKTLSHSLSQQCEEIKQNADLVYGQLNSKIDVLNDKILEQQLKHEDLQSSLTKQHLVEIDALKDQIAQRDHKISTLLQLADAPKKDSIQVQQPSREKKHTKAKEKARSGGKAHTLNVSLNEQNDLISRFFASPAVQPDEKEKFIYDRDSKEVRVLSNPHQDDFEDFWSLQEPEDLPLDFESPDSFVSSPPFLLEESPIHQNPTPQHFRGQTNINFFADSSNLNATSSSQFPQQSSFGASRYNHNSRRRGNFNARGKQGRYRRY